MIIIDFGPASTTRLIWTAYGVQPLGEIVIVPEALHPAWHGALLALLCDFGALMVDRLGRLLEGEDFHLHTRTACPACHGRGTQRTYLEEDVSLSVETGLEPSPIPNPTVTDCTACLGRGWRAQPLLLTDPLRWLEQPGLLQRIVNDLHNPEYSLNADPGSEKGSWAATYPPSASGPDRRLG
jgi:hypothetical protein